MTQPTATSRYEANPAPGTLALVQELANTVSIATMPDLLASCDSASQWWTSIAGAPAPAIEEESLARLRQLRSALRSALGEDAARPQAPLDLTLRLSLDESGITVQNDVFNLTKAGVTAEVEAGIAVGLLEWRATGTLSRLKLCANPQCRVAFFDHSKNGAGKWHSATRCGNAARVRAHRSTARSAAGTVESSAET